MADVARLLRSRSFVRIAHAGTGGAILLGAIALVGFSWERFGEHTLSGFLTGLMFIPVGIVAAVASGAVLLAALDYDGRLGPRIGLGIFDGVLLVWFFGLIGEGLGAMGEPNATPEWWTWPTLLLLTVWFAILLASVCMPPKAVASAGPTSVS